MKSKRVSLAVFTIALAARVLFLIVTPPAELSYDAGDYDALARRLLEGKGYVNADGEPTSRRPPGYALFLAGLYWAAGQNVAAVGLAQAVLDAATCLMVFVLASRMFGRHLAIVAAAFSIFSFGQISAARLILSESLATFFVVLATLLLHTGLFRPSRIALGAAGIAFGLGVLTRATISLLPLLAGGVILHASRGHARKALGHWAIVMLCFGLTLLPWVIRNYGVHRQLVLVVTQTGQMVYSSYNPPQGKIFGVDAEDETFKRIRALPEADQTSAFLAETFRYVREHLGILPKLMLLKIIYFVSPIDWELIPGTGVVNFTFAFSAPFAAYGLWLGRRYGWQAGLLAMPLAGFFLVAMLIQGSPRYRLPMEPFMAIFSALGLVQIVHRFKERRALVLTGIGGYFAATFACFLFSTQVRSFARFTLRGIGLW